MSKKDYKQGMSDAMEAYEGFGRKQEAAIRHVGEEVAKTAGKVDKLGGKIGEIADYITDQEKAALYKLNTPIDIANLEDAEKRILLAVLYQLSANEDEVTEEQQNYVRAVQQYLKIYNPQTEIDLAAVENIEDISTQKAVLQSVLEFFRLGTHPEELTEDQEDFLDYFQVNRRTRREIDGCIEAIVEAVGIQGLSEKYGFVVKQPQSAFATYKDNGPIPERVADICAAQFGKHLFREFPRMYGHRFLETQDYLLYYQETHDGDLSPEGFYCVEKRTGSIERINFDIPSKRSWFKQLTFYIWKNVVYFIEKLDIHENPYINADNLFELNLKTKICRKMTFEVPCQHEAYYHLSGNDTYLMVHASETDLLTEPLQVKSSKTYVIDLAHGERSFLLNPPMERIIDAFIWDNKFIFSGAIGKNKDCKVALYKFDIEHKTLEELLRPTGDVQVFNSTLGKILGANTYGGFYCNTVQNIRYVNKNYYFLMHEMNSAFSESDVLYRLPENVQQADYGDFLITRNPYFYEDSAIFFEITSAYVSAYKYDFSTLELMRLDHTKIKAKCSSKSSYFLIGDYLYKYISQSNEWFRTNISGDMTTLQWEIIHGFNKAIFG